MGPRNPTWLLVLSLGLVVAAAYAQPPAAGGEAPEPILRLAALGDQGDDNVVNGVEPIVPLGKTLARLQATEATRFDGLLFLGDNFYPRGLNDANWQEKRDHVLRNFRGLLPRERVHAVAGNHDYYRFLLPKALSARPYGFTMLGNKREEEIADWTYHWWWPGEAIFTIAPGVQVAVFFFDSARVIARGKKESQAEFVELTKWLKTSDSRQNPYIRWRILVMHHPLYTQGQHNCAVGRTGFRSVEEIFPLQDTCQTGYKEFAEELKKAIQASGVKVHLALTGHDHSLQLIDSERLSDYADRGPNPDPPLVPTVHVIAGAAAEATRVRQADPTHGLYTTAFGDAPSESLYGFAELQITKDVLRVRFLGAEHGEPLRMGEACEFRVANDGRLQIPQRGDGCPK